MTQLGTDITRKKILVVDDDKTTASILCLYLENFGFSSPAMAQSAGDAILKTKKLRPDLVLMDIRLGKGLDGIDAAEIIVNKMGARIVYITAYSDKETLERVQFSKPAGFINKPIRETDLKTTLSFIFNQQEATPKKRNNRKKPVSAIEALQGIYHLTRAEAKVVAAFLEKPDVREIAASLNVSISTVHTHLKHIFRKTDTRRQSALLHKIVTGPALTIIDR